MKKLLIYGANGYTGKLIARNAADFGLQPVLAGRNEAKIIPLAKELNLPFEILDLSQHRELDKALEEVELVLHAAGPFIRTARPMMEACIRTKTHYIDITGEMGVFEMAARLGPKAEKAGIMLLPGAGFDVVPTDCMAVYLKNKLPDATHLKLAFAWAGESGVSHGTALTMIESLGELGAVRSNGKITRVPTGHKTLTFPAGDRQLFAMTIPWGDVSTAWYSTGIPNIEVYSGIAPATYKKFKWAQHFNALLRMDFVKNLIRKRIEKRPPGPTEAQRKNSRAFIWGEVINAEGKTCRARLETPDGYTLTMLTSLIITGKILHGDFKPGFQTPAMAYGPDLILEVESVIREDL